MEIVKIIREVDVLEIYPIYELSPTLIHESMQPLGKALAYA